MNKPQNFRLEIFFGVFILLFSGFPSRADQSVDKWTQALTKVFSSGTYADYAALLHPSCPKSDKDPARFQMVQDVFKKEGAPRIESEPYAEKAAATGVPVRFTIQPTTSFYINRMQDQKQVKFEIAVGAPEKDQWYDIGSGCEQVETVAAVQTGTSVSGAQPQAAMPLSAVQPQADATISRKALFEFAPKDSKWPLEWHVRIGDDEVQKTKYDIVLEEVKEKGATPVAVLIASKWIQAKEGDPVEFRFYVNLEKAAPDGTYPYGFSRTAQTMAKSKVKAYAQTNWFSAVLGIKTVSDIEIKKEFNAVETRIELVRFKSLIKDQTKQFSISLLKKAL